MTALLEVHDLGVSYGGVRAVTGVDLQVERGSCTTIIGANGAGKTSLLRGIGGLTRTDRGSQVRLDGEPLERFEAASRAKRGLGHCLEGRHVFPGLTVEENLELGTVAAGDRTGFTLADVFEVLPDLEGLRRIRGGALSGGQQQFLAIGRALAGAPLVLLLDEPTNGLAPILVDRVVEIVQRLRDAGLGVLLVEQRLEVAQAVGDEVLLMATGTIVHRTRGDDPELADKAHTVYLGRDLPAAPAAS